MVRLTCCTSTLIPQKDTLKMRPETIRETGIKQLHSTQDLEKEEEH